MLVCNKLLMFAPRILLEEDKRGQQSPQMEKFMLKVRGEGKNSGEEEEVSGFRLQTPRTEAHGRLYRGLMSPTDQSGMASEILAPSAPRMF